MDSDPIAPPPPEPFPSGSPFAREPEQPRLGISHLMVWTAFAAVYFSLISTGRHTLFGMLDDGVGISIWVAYGVGASAALASLPMAAVRRWRGLPYPGQPGETLLLLLGVNAVINVLLLLVVMMLAEAGEGTDVGVAYGLRTTGACCGSLFLVVFYLIAAIKTKPLRWRLCFAAMIVATILAHVLPSMMMFFLSTMRWYLASYYGPHVIVSALLIAVAARDFREHVSMGIRYRWTHWLGISIHLWHGAVFTVYAIWWMLFCELP